MHNSLIDVTRPGQAAGGAADDCPVDAALALYRWMRTARQVDAIERELIARGEAFFHVGGAGHEASAALAPFLTPHDYLHCHYRDKALLLARGVPLRQFFDGLLCNAASASAGRQMSAHLCAPALHVLSTVGPVGNNALQAVGVAQQVKALVTQPVVLCSLGDGSTQQGEVLEAIAEAVRSELPVLFLVHDNRYAISTRTAGHTFFSLPDGPADSFHGIVLDRVDGSRPAACHAAFRRIVERVRRSRAPAICILAVERLTDHTNADDEAVYRSAAERQRIGQDADPIVQLQRWLIARGVAAPALASLHDEIDAEVRAAAEMALDEPPPALLAATLEPVPPHLADPSLERRGSPDAARLTMAEALRDSLRARMQQDPRVTLYGQDIEDPKGDVFGVTRGLTCAFPDRVHNAPLSESTIVGTSIGRALAGGRPVACIQFADFLPLAFNQIASELATMAWRTQGGWRAPVIVMAPCGGYRAGLGPFHAQTCDSLLAHLPGIDVVVPSTATDAAAALNAAFASERPTAVLYPKALLHARSALAPADVAALQMPIGVARLVRAGDDLTLVGWGNTVALCEQAAETLAGAGVSAEVIDLRWLAPWDRAAVLRSAARTRRLLVVHEDNQRGGFGAEVVASVAEALGGGVSCRRVARPDVFIPCHFESQLAVLPSYRSVLEAAAAMLALDLRWSSLPAAQAGLCVVPVIGSSPTDQTVQLVQLAVAVGEPVLAGQTLASVEADKAVADIAAPVDGVVRQIHLQPGQVVAVGSALLSIAVTVAAPRRHQPVATPQALLAPWQRTTTGLVAAASQPLTVVLAGLGSCCGSERLDNEMLAPHLPALHSAGGIFERTGIVSRSVAAPDQDIVGMAAAAAHKALHEAGITAHDLSLLICSTSTPALIAPSTACQLLQRLAPDAELPAYDVLAACSGYLYALAQAWDFLQQQPQAQVLVVTTETMRRIVDIDDPQTSPIFGDAATATVLRGAGVAGGAARCLAALQRPVLGAQGDDGSALRVPLPGPGAWVQMDGKRVFGEAIRRMGGALAQACAQAGVAVGELDLVVPHQANGRIIDNLRTRLKLAPERVWNGIRDQGNTSSSSIPLALDTALRRLPSAQRIGLCTFGAGYTFGAALLTR